MKILIADDEHAARERLLKFLKDHPWCYLLCC